MYFTYLFSLHTLYVMTKWQILKSKELSEGRGGGWNWDQTSVDKLQEKLKQKF